MNKCDTCGGCSQTKKKNLEGDKITIDLLMDVLENNDMSMKNHANHVGTMSKWLAQYLGIDSNLCDTIELAGRLHDIGMIKIAPSLFNKKETLSEKDWKILKKHPEYGFEILNQYPELNEVAQIVLEHHEHFDGTGYPNGYLGNEIHLGARIIALCETVDHMSTKKPYKEASDFKIIEEEIRQKSGSQFDPWLVMHIKELMIVWQETLIGA
ncbi:Phosphohydrolase [Petrocella atlantisensis]|uniref:Phosphohydrolase n=1 Tax=Petrocella atlantisensis TaxID=2173034 RepID=A0A3P7NSN7_9FIRM|nr:HD domain-containing phosphohydrolase [Petrocella atlantisensis]PKM53871.1 MAG: phosphohydrolase [Firmicutes bacterium HGW-Firmicutes-5]VDN45915.1 Phosphohydrolase [Petrocella atlantisensis]